MALNYEPLDVDSYEIRMLTILPGPPESAVRCTMEKTNLISPINYTALSYCWGDTTITTNIFVNGIETPVTTNLADALQHLRRLGVRRVWADALCINQTDKQEKGLQIRNMKHIYSKADITYSWLGREEVDGTMPVIAFLMSLVDSHDDKALAQTSHTCISMTSRLLSARQLPPQNGDCSRCKIESHFQGLQQILQRQYWKRRWIIQETSVTYRHVVLCDDAAITLDEMDRAITRCRESCFWGLDTERAYSWFKTTTKFRHSYQEDAKPSLCQAIGLSREFESTDPRDAIFSLLGLCHDGPELVPTPNYFQPVETIVMNLTRALIRKHKHLDFILINRINRTGSEVFPSWAPNWLSGNLPSQAYDLTEKRAEARFCLGDSIGRNLPLGDGMVLRVQGINISRIVSMSSTTDPTGVASLYPSHSTSSVSFSDSPTPIYYTSYQVLTALLSCLTLDPQSQRNQHVYFEDHKWSPVALVSKTRVIWHIFCLRCVIPKTQPSQLNPESSDVENSKLHSKRIFSQWLEINATLPIHGKTLEGWTKEQNSYLMRVVDSLLDSLLDIPFVILLILATLSPPITTIMLLNTGHFSTVLLCFTLISCCVCIFLCLIILLHADYRQHIKKSKILWDDMTHLVEPGKKLIVAENGFLGMVDERAKKGDMLFNLMGCSEPVVLREVGGNGDGDRSRRKYTVVGKCYVHFTEPDRYEYLGPEEPLRAGTESKRSKHKELKEEWMKKSEKAILEEIDLV